MMNKRIGGIIAALVALLALVTPAVAQGATGGGSGASSLINNVLPIILMFAIFYFIVFRPQQQRMKEHRETVANVRRGDTVVTAGGIIGKVTKVVDEHEIQVEIADKTRVRMLKSTLSDVRSKTEPVKD